MLHKIVSFFLFSAISLSLIVSPVDAAYRDVSETHQYSTAVTYLTEEGVMSGIGYFFPGRTVTRAELLKIGLLSAGYDELREMKSSRDLYDDVESDAWYGAYVERADKLNAFPESPEKKFSPGKRVTRIEALQALLRIFDAGIPRFVPESFSFRDVSHDAWFAPIAFRAYELGIMDIGQNNMMMPFAYVTRGEIAEISYRLRSIQKTRSESFRDFEISHDESPRIIISQVSQNDAKLSLFWEIWRILDQNYINPENIDEQRQVYGAIAGMVDSLDDPYTKFFTPKENEDLTIALTNNLTGIGAYLGEKNGKMIIISPIKGSPAERVGIMPGDAILKVDGETINNLTVNELASKIRGKIGTRVNITISRENKIYEFDIVRAKINIKSVNLQMKDNGVAYISISQFTDDTSAGFDQAVKQAISQNARGLILDLRNNPGGYLEGAIDVASYFLPKGAVISKTIDKYGNETLYESKRDGELQNMTTVVMVNGGSASASEIVAGALQDYKKATLLGQKTFGKGTAQIVTRFTDGSSLKLTIAKWYTPTGTNIDHDGINPNLITIPSTDLSVDRDLDRAMHEF